MVSSPTVWRRWLAHELTRLRKEAALERGEVAEKLRCSTQKVGHIETAFVPPKVRDLEEILLPLYGVTEDRRPYYVQAAKDARQKGWWDNYADALPDWFSLYLGLEQGAAEVYNWETQLVPGLLQTREYAAAVIRGGTAEIDDAALQRRIELRLQRRAVFEDSNPLRLWVVLDEAALHRNVGGAAVMQEQLQHLVTMAELPRVTVQILRTASGAHPGMLGSFTILKFPESTDPGVVYLEHRTGSLYLEEPWELKEHEIAFQHLQGLALSPSDSLSLLADVVEGLSCSVQSYSS